MSRDAAVTLDWGPDTYTFRLGWGELEMLQEGAEMGPWLILHRLQTKLCKVGEISEVIRCGLIGGGIAPAKAKKLVDTYVRDRPPMENLLFAVGILSSALHGAPEEDAGEGEAANQEAEKA